LNLDFIENPVLEDKDYSKKIWAAFENLKVLDGFDKDGEECLSEIEDEGEGDFDGEGEGLEEFIDVNDLNEEEKRELEKQGFTLFEAEGEDFEDEGDEEGDSEEEADVKAGAKRTKGAEKADDSNKRQKTDE
jgi:hypothetical protein